MFMLILPFSVNTMGRGAALFEHSLVICLSSALQRSLGARCADLYPGAGDGEVMALTRSLSEEEGRECAREAGADFFLWGDLSFRPEGKRRLERVSICLRMAATQGDAGRLSSTYGFSGFLEHGGRGQLLELSALLGLVRRMTLDIGGALGYPESAIDLSGIDDGMTMDPEAWAHFVTALRFASSYENKERFYLEALSRDPGLSVAYVNLARIYLSRNMLEKAKALLLRGYDYLEGEMAGDDLLGLVAFCAVKEGAYDEALMLWERVASGNPSRAEAWYNMGNIHHLTGRQDRALACYRRAVEVDGTFPLARFGLGRLFAEMGRARDAIREMGIYMELMPGDPWAYSIIGSCLLETGERQAALFALKKAAQLDPHGEAGMRARKDLERL